MMRMVCKLMGHVCSDPVMGLTLPLGAKLFVTLFTVPNQWVTRQWNRVPRERVWWGLRMFRQESILIRPGHDPLGSCSTTLEKFL